MLKLQKFYAFLSRMSKREKFIFYGAALFIFLAVMDRLVISPILSKITSLNKEIQEKGAAIKRNTHILSNRDRVSAEKVKYASFLNKFESAAGEDETSLLKEIETLANEASVYIIDIKPAGAKTGGGYSMYTVKLNCEAQMENVISFMYNIENSNDLLTIINYKITPKSKDSSIASCSMSVSKRLVSK